MKSKIFLFRHAHRNVFNPLDDNGLSEKGLKQVNILTEVLSSQYELKTAVFYSSPRLRCQQTLQPLAQKLSLSLHEEPLLDEAAKQKIPLHERVLTFVNQIKKTPEQTFVICSHGDWIPVFFSVTMGSELHLRKSGLAIIELIDGEFKLEKLIQDWNSYAPL